MGGSSKQTQTSTTALPQNQQANVDLLMQGARDVFNSGGAQYYPGQTIAGPNAQQLQARQGATNYATGVGGAFADQAVKTDQFWMNPENIFNPQNIPGFAAAQKGVTQDVTRNLTENILPSIRQGSVATGSLGGSRQGIGEGLAIGRTNDVLAKALGDMSMNAYGQGLQMQNSALSRAPQTYGLGLAPQDTMGRVGAEYQSDEQRMIDEAMKKFNFEQLAPLLNLQALQGFTGNAGQYGGTNTQTTQQSGGSDWMKSLGGLLSLGSLLPIPGAAGMGKVGGSMIGGGG